MERKDGSSCTICSLSLHGRTVERSAVYPVYDARDVYSCVAVPGLPFFFSCFRSSLPVQQKRTPTLDTALREQKKPSAKSFSVSAFTPTRLPRSFSFFFVFVGSGGTLDSVVCKHDETRFRRGSRPRVGTKEKCFFFPLGGGGGGSYSRNPFGASLLIHGEEKKVIT